MKIKKDWDKIRTGSKINLKVDTLFRGLCKEDKDFIIPRGTYFINGFWANSCGISKIRNSHINDFGFYSIQLKKFEEVTND